MHCVFNATRDYLHYQHHLDLNQDDFNLYLAAKQVFQGQTDEYTDEAGVPFILGWIAKRHQMRLIVEYKLWGRDAYLNITNRPYSERQKKFIAMSEWGTDVERLENFMCDAIFCSAYSAHAMFAHLAPIGTRLAIKMEELP